MNINWDADKYTLNFSFVHRYGNSVMELISAKEHSAVLDLGCGNGALTRALHEKGFNAMGLDASNELLAIARKNNPNLEFFYGDATDFVLREPVDVVFSNAVFHWIDKDRQQKMMECVHRALRKNGEFVFELGGHGNNILIHDTLEAAFAERGYCYKMPFYFPTVGEYAGLLEKNGFKVTYAVLFDRFTELEGENGLEDWINMFVKTPFSVIGTEQEKRTVISKAVNNLREKLFVKGKWHADYVRLRMKAVRL